MAAFTLAEVLITLGVVGIIAAMTLPMLAENYQRIVVQTRLKKFYTTFNHAILRSIEVNGPFDGWLYNVPNVRDEDGVLVNQTQENHRIFNYYLRPYLSVLQTQQVIYTNNYDSILYYLSDGSAFSYTSYDNRDILYYPKDPVRCLKSPAKNRAGVCEFRFLFVPNYTKSSLQINHSQWKYHIDKGLEPYMYNWDGNPERFYEEGNIYSCHPDSEGAMCVTAIYYNGWQFPKDYPRKIRY